MGRRHAWILVCLLAAWPGTARGQAPAASSAPLDALIGQPVSAVTVVSLGAEVRSPQVLGLLEVRPGDRLTMAAVRRTVVHLMGLGTYLDVRVTGDRGPSGVALRVDLVPLRDVSRLAFVGDTGLPERVLRDAVIGRFGTPFPIGRATDIASTLEEVYRDYGFLRASVRARPLDDPAVARGDLVFDVAPGRRATIKTISYRGSPESAVDEIAGALDLEAGDEYAPAALRARLNDSVEAFHRAGFLEARADPFPRVDPSGVTVDLVIVVTRGPRVSVAFAGDPLPAKERDTLVPVAREGSADEDLLEDSQQRIEQYLRAEGYRDARASFTRVESGDQLTIVFTVTRGPLYRVAAIALDAGPVDPPAGTADLIRTRPGDPFVAARLGADLSALTDHYRRRGYPQATVTPDVTAGTPAPGTPDVPVSIRLAVAPGPQARVGAIVFEGATALSAGQLMALIRARSGDPFVAPLLNADRDALVADYRDRGYRAVTVDVRIEPAPSGDADDVRFVIQEGPQILVDQILITGNTRTSEATIRREVVLYPGAALGDAAVAESQRRLAALGLFRRVTISELQHTAANLRDVLIAVEEAPATTVGYGGGVEFQKVETSEFAPRGFIELGRRNLWGKNRSVNFFGRVSVRRRGGQATALDTDPSTETDLEYRVVGAYREPRFLDTRGDLQVAAVFEQGSRTSFRYRHRSVRVGFAERVGQAWSYIGQFAFERNEILDDNINPIDRPLIDRLFPQVRLSSLSATVARDTRDDAIEPGRGTLVSLNGELALRAIGSEVGYAKTFLQSFAFHRVAAFPRLVLAGGARLGLGTGFARDVDVTTAEGTPVTGPDGRPLTVTVRDLPASERFFAGGDTTVRGFQLDRLGTPETFDRDGTPIGGHAEFVLNAEARVAVWRDLGLVGFLDGGNVFALVNDVSLGELRAGAGFGLRYKSPVGPIRVDFGFKLGTLRTYGPNKEDRFALHISIGQAF